MCWILWYPGGYSYYWGENKKQLLLLKSKLVKTPFGTVEFSLRGDEGPVVIISHGGAGGFDQGFLTASSHLNGDFRIISVSRFGHPGSPMVKGANAEMQADAYASLLDFLEIDRAAIIGTSGGGPSAIQFAQRHRLRCSVLVLSCAVTKYYPPRPTSVYKSDFLYWFITTYLRKVAKNLTVVERRFLDKLFETMNPISLRRDGLFCDIAEWSDQAAWERRYHLGRIVCPTLIIHAEDDAVMPFSHALHAKELIQDSELFSLPDGGHLKLGHFSTISKKTSDFIILNAG
jgi:pimeloyl-ACP methyl ester carboxylesterase